MLFAEDVRAEERRSFGIVKKAEYRGVNVPDILGSLESLDHSASPFGVSANPGAEIPERVFHSLVGGAFFAGGFDLLPSLVGEVEHQSVERLDDCVAFSDQLEVSLFQGDKRSEREFAVAAEDADGYLAENGREKTDAATAERDRADVAFQREICHFVRLDEIAVAQGAIVGIGVRRD